MMNSEKLILASGSPRRLELLRRIGVRVEVSPPAVDETPDRKEPAESLVRRLALSKSLSVADRFRGGVDRTVLAADTVVVMDGRILGKPAGREEAEEMLRTLSGAEHRVITGMAACRTRSHAQAITARTTRVRFRPLPDRWLAWYLATGEPVGKAGAYAIQGAGSLLVEAIHGSWSNVVGLPVESLPDLMSRLGVSLLDLSDLPDLGEGQPSASWNDQPIMPE